MKQIRSYCLLAVLLALCMLVCLSACTLPQGTPEKQTAALPTLAAPEQNVPSGGMSAPPEEDPAPQEFPLGLTLTQLRTQYADLIISDDSLTELYFGWEQLSALPEEELPVFPAAVVLGFTPSCYEGAWLLIYASDADCCGAFHLSEDWETQAVVGEFYQEDEHSPHTMEELIEKHGEGVARITDPVTGETVPWYVGKDLDLFHFLPSEETEWLSMHGVWFSIGPSPREYAERRAAAEEGMSEEFLPLSEEEIIAELEGRRPEDAINRYCLFLDNYATRSVDCTLFSYENGYCAAAWRNINMELDGDGRIIAELVCCLLFDREKALREVVVGSPAELPETAALEEALLGKNREEICAAFGGVRVEEYDGNTSDVLLTADGRLVILPITDRDGGDPPTAYFTVYEVFTGEKEMLGDFGR